MGRLVLVPLLAAVVFALLGYLSQHFTEQRRIEAVEAAVLTTGRSGPVEVEPLPGEECGRAREGFRWRTAAEEGWACAGPQREVALREAGRRTTEGP